MNAPIITNGQLLRISGDFWQWRWLWLSTTAVFAFLGLVYVIFLKSDVWMASQGLIVRDEANGAVMRLGRFESQTAMKAAQETVLEMARNSQVLGDALEVVGREKSMFGWLDQDSAPTSAELDDLAKQISVRAPRGAELGTTEVIYLDVKQTSRPRALEFVKAISDALENRLKQVRQARANGVMIELQAAKEAAETNLKKATIQLQQMEADVGNDLSDLRALTDANANGSSTRQTLDSIAQELHVAELDRQQVKVDLETARESYDNPDQLLQTPTKLVNSHPGLRRLREGLAAASIASSQLSGRYTDSHPRVIASRETENRIRAELRAELGTSVRTLTKDFQLASDRVEKLKKQRDSLESRIAKLASIRADYSNVASEVRSRNIRLQESERDLAAAEAARDAAQTSSLITRIDEPIVGEKPVGPGRSTILAGATLSGLFFGMGLVFLLSPMDGSTNFGRRKLDHTKGSGRRASDRNEQESVPQSESPGMVAVNAAKETVTSVISQVVSSAASALQKKTNPSAEQQASATESDVETASRAANIDAETNATSVKADSNTHPESTGPLPPTTDLLQTNTVHVTAPFGIGQLDNDQDPARDNKKAKKTLAECNEKRGKSGAQTEEDQQTSKQQDQDKDQDQDKASIVAAQAVIAAALQCSFSEEANSAPQSNSTPTS